ncbi:hypothetical protein [Acuticoccus sediminis]|nr:hypothetical protein [Acuticoccus sediminis]
MPSGIEVHQDMVATLAATMEVEDVNGGVMAERQQCTDGVTGLA